jgi:predicted phage baseplate assembly protein
VSSTLLPDPANVFLLDAEAGLITFGDGAHGRRPPQRAKIRATYDFSVGAAGNVGPNSINTSPVLPPGFKAANPIPTWGGADAETASQGEKQISRYLQHRDRLVTAYDFETIALRTPGVEIARVEVLPNFHPELSNGRGGDAPGALTLMLIPTFDAGNPNAPSPTSDFLDAVCGYLDPRRLVTAEVFLRGPEYVGIWVSIGIQVLPGAPVAPVREAVKAAILNFLAPATPGPQQLPDDPATLFNAPQTALYKGWPLAKPVIALELMAVAGRVAGVEFVQEALLAKGTTDTLQVDLTGLQLPQVLGISVTEGAALGLDELRGGPTQPAPGRALTGVAQVPIIPEECS